MNSTGWNGTLGLAALLSITVLVACGDSAASATPDAGDSTDAGPTLLTGFFNAGVVEGLGYSTATQSGQTNASGEFSYMSGETVEFSVGGIVLGSASAAAVVTPFDLVGIQPPSTELPLRNELSASYRSGPFQTATNMMQLLMTLDDDDDWNNGINLTAWSTPLANATVNFERPIEDFAFEDYHALRRKYHIARVVQPLEVLPYLYQKLDIQVPVRVRVSSAWDSGNDNTINSVSEDSFHESGLLASHKFDNNADGFFEGGTTYLYDGKFRETAEAEIEYGPDGITPVAVSTYSLAYDSMGHRSSYTSEYDDDGNTSIESSSKDVYSYNADGQLTTEVSTSDDDHNGVPEYERTFTYTYDDNGNRLTSERSTDSNANGTVDSRILITYTYDSENRRTSLSTRTDDDANGDFESHVETIYTYDASGYLTLEVQNSDSNNDSNVNSTVRSTFTYDAQGRRLTLLQEDDYTNNGSVNLRVLATLTYNDAGQVLSQILARDNNGDNSYNRIDTTTSTYNPAGQRLTHIQERDLNNNGTADYINTAITTYDSNGGRLTRVYELDSDANGNLDTRSTITTVNDDRGNQLSSLRTNDDDGDGNVDSESLRTYDYTELADGVAYLSAIYFEL